MPSFFGNPKTRLSTACKGTAHEKIVKFKNHGQPMSVLDKALDELLSNSLFSLVCANRYSGKFFSYQDKENGDFFQNRTGLPFFPRGLTRPDLVDGTTHLLAKLKHNLQPSLKLQVSWGHKK